MSVIYRDGNFSKISFNFSFAKRKTILFASVFFMILLTNVNSHEHNEEEITETINKKTITCGSTLRILNVMTKFK